MYHRIADESFDPWGTVVSPTRFAQQIEWLSRRRTVLPLHDFAELHRTRELPPDAIAITFDDGYSCNATAAAPLLEQVRLPATIFLPVEWIEKGTPSWWDEIREIVFKNDRQVLRVGGREIELGERHPKDNDWKYGAPPRTPRQAAFREVWLELILKTPSQIDRAMKDLRAQYGSKLDAKPFGASPMSPHQVRRAASTIIEFGSHALRHPALTSLSRREQAREISDSIARCEALAGSRPRSFAYPFGIFDDRIEQLVKEAGFSCACSVETAAVSPSSRTYALPRMQVGNWPARKLKTALALL
jgi:peptidoglycan/xylan/chitin deacetylase (PgdA/CDA1 family)